MIPINELIVTQADIRANVPMASMIQFVKAGNVWTKEALAEYAKEHNLKPSPLIQISRFEDGRKFLHDGHHRTVATYLGGREELLDVEYEIHDWTYALYAEFNPTVGWVTPFDPRTHIRNSDLHTFKSAIRQQWKLIQDGISSFTLADLEALVHARSHEYSSLRSFTAVADLASTWSQTVLPEKG